MTGTSTLHVHHAEVMAGDLRQERELAQGRGPFQQEAAAAGRQRVHQGERGICGLPGLRIQHPVPAPRDTHSIDSRSPGGHREPSRACWTEPRLLQIFALPESVSTSVPVTPQNTTFKPCQCNQATAIQAAVSWDAQCPGRFTDQVTAPCEL